MAISGLLLLLAGIAWPRLSRLPIGRLPGDPVIDRPGFKAFFPFASMVLISLAVSLMLRFFRL
jgi:hypothetical protein